MYTPYPQYPKQIPPTPKWKRALAVCIILIIAAIIATYMPSCTTAKNAPTKAGKLMDKYPEKVLPVFRGKFPCTTTGVTTTFDSTAYKNYLEELQSIDQFYKDLLDNIEPEFIHDTARLTDSARCNELKDAYRRNEAKWIEKVKVLYSRISVLTDAVDKIPAVEKLQQKSVEDSSKLREAAIRESRLTSELAKEKKRADKAEKRTGEVIETRNWLWLVVFGLIVFCTRKVWWKVLSKMRNPLS